MVTAQSVSPVGLRSLSSISYGQCLPHKPFSADIVMLSCVSHYFLLVTNEAEHLFICIFVRNTSYLLMYLFSVSPNFSFFNFNSSLYIMNTNPSSTVCFVYVFYV